MASSATTKGWKSRNLNHVKQTTKGLEEENARMEERLMELRMAMDREKSQREKSQAGFWKTGQIGTLSSYGKEAMQNKVDKMKKKSGKKIRILQEEKITPVDRKKGPGTIAYIASRGKGGTKDLNAKGPRCGQCEDNLANRKCVECGEDFCASCFAVFHLKGALKKHRAVPLGAKIEHQPETPKTTGRVLSSHREQSSIREKPSTGQELSIGAKHSLLEGSYDEKENAASFQQALGAWRKDNTPSQGNPSPNKNRSESSVFSTDCGTSTADNKDKLPLQIKFTNSLSYAEKLLLKTSRRALSQTPQANDDASFTKDISLEAENTWDSPVSRIGLGFTEGHREDTDSKWQSAPGLSYDDRPESSISIIEINDESFNNKQDRLFEEPSFYHVHELPTHESNSSIAGSRKEAFTEGDNYTKKQTGNYVPVKKYENENYKSISKSPSSNTEKPPSGLDSLRFSLDTDNSKMRRVGTPDKKSKSQLQKDSNKRPTSRLASARKRPSSRFEVREGLITRAPSASLQEIAKRGMGTEFHQSSYQTFDLANFFIPGTQNRKENTGETPREASEKLKDSTSMNQQWKVSNKLYQMVPRSWKPEQSLTDVSKRSVSSTPNTGRVHRENVPDDIQSSANSGRITPNLMFKSSKVLTPRPNSATPHNHNFVREKSKSKVMVPTTDDQFDDDISTTFEESNKEDVLTLKLLGDELADEEKKSSRRGHQDHLEHGQNKEMENAAVQLVGLSTESDLGGKNVFLRASMMDDYEIMEQQMMEDDVKALQ